MKKLISLKPLLIHSILIMGTMLLATSCSENRTVDSKEAAQQDNLGRLTTDDRTMVVVDNDNDANFLMEAAEMQLEKINLGKLAQQRGGSDHVKELGKMMEDDHTKFFGELKTLAKSKSISIPMTATDDSNKAYKDLEGKAGNDFGKAYSSLMVEHHEDAIELFEKASNDSKDMEIRTWATQKLPGLRMHLQHAEECKEKCENTES